MTAIRLTVLRHCLWLTAFLSCAAIGADLPHNAWSQVQNPSAGPTEIIGGFAAGCIAGAASLPLDGPGYEVIRPSRRRYFGDAQTVDFVADLGRRAQEAGLPLFYVGDVGQPRGGPLPFGHLSHQTGLDVDIWFTTATTPNLPLSQREMPDLPSMLLPHEFRVDPARFSASQVTLLRLAATDPRVERIFVNPAIKLALCRGFGGVADSNGSIDWLHRLSPWWGHDDHFHVRLHCPDGQSACIAQRPVEPGDGCDAGLEHWASHQTLPAATTPTTPSAPRKLPVACQSVLTRR